MKKTISLLLALLLIAALFVGCSSQKKPDESKTPETTKAQTPSTTEAPATTEAPTTTEARNTDPEGIFVTVNGANVTVGVPFADLEEALGSPTAPAEVIESCDEGSDWKQTMHYYEGVIITENKDGVIDGVQVSDGDAALMGKIRIGATRDEVIDLLGTPDTDESWGIMYENTSPRVNFYLDDETGLISGFALMGGD